MIAQEHLINADELRKAARWVEARRSYLQLLERFPDATRQCAWASYRIAQCFFLEGRNAEAAAFCAEYLGTSSPGDWPGIRLRMAILLKRMGQERPALAALRAMAETGLVKQYAVVASCIILDVQTEGQDRESFNIPDRFAEVIRRYHPDGLFLIGEWFETEGNRAAARYWYGKACEYGEADEEMRLRLAAIECGQDVSRQMVHPKTGLDCAIQVSGYKEVP